MSEFPEILIELANMAKSGELMQLDLSAFMTGPSLKEVYEEIDKTDSGLLFYI